MTQQTAVEKASKLISYYLPFCNQNLTDAKYCALIAVDEIIEATNMHQFALANGRKTIPAKIVNHPYWQAVKQEIEKL